MKAKKLLTPLLIAAMTASMLIGCGGASGGADADNTAAGAIGSSGEAGGGSKRLS